MEGYILIIGTFDTKGEELRFLRKEILSKNQLVRTLDVGILQSSQADVDIPNEKVAFAAGQSLQELVCKKDRGKAVTVMANGAARIAMDLFRQREVKGVISLGGGSGTAIATNAMRCLPVGLPKVMVSSVASGNTRPYIATSDIVMIPSVVDIAGLNRISKKIIRNAAAAICGMAKEMEGDPSVESSPLIATTMFGVTTPCVMEAKRKLEEKGYEVLVFHANGTGGRAMEELIKKGEIKAVLDITTTELADELLGGKCSAGPNRLEKAGEIGIPQVIVPGAMDMVNFFPDSIPAQFCSRLIYNHNPATALMRTNIEENTRLGKIMAEKLLRSIGSTAVFIPKGGFSALDAPGCPFFDPDADFAFIKALKQNLPPRIQLIEVEAHINEPSFATRLIQTLFKMMEMEKS